MAANIYRHRFHSKCPANQQDIDYLLEIHSESMVYVEEIVAACRLFPCSYHEAIADRLATLLPGLQFLRAHHHGVDIETTRGALQ